MNTYPPEVVASAFRDIAGRTKGWISALGWLAFVYGLITVIKVAVSSFAAFGYLSVPNMTYPLMMSAASGLLGLVVSLALIPLGIILIRAGGNLKSFLATDDFSDVIAYQGKIRTSAIIVVVVLTVDILSTIATAFIWAALAMSSFSLIGD